MTDPHPQPGEAAPDATLYDEAGREIQLADFWRRLPTIFLFARHFG